MEELNTTGVTQFRFVKRLNKKQVSSVYTYPVRKPGLSVCFEILKLIYPITTYRLYELTGSPKKTDHSSSGNSCSGQVYLACDGFAFISFLHSHILECILGPRHWG